MEKYAYNLLYSVGKVGIPRRAFISMAAFGAFPLLASCLRGEDLESLATREDFESHRITSADPTGLMPVTLNRAALSCSPTFRARDGLSTSATTLPAKNHTICNTIYCACIGMVSCSRA